MSCTCQDCSQLNNFLSDGRQTQFEIPAGRKTRMHIAGQINRVHLGEVSRCHHPAANPQSLVVTKKPGTRAKRERLVWFRKAVQAKEYLLSVPEEILRKFLDAEFFQILPEATMQAMLGESFEDFKHMCRTKAPLTTAVATPERQVEAGADVVSHQPAAKRRKRALESPREHVGMRTRTRRKLTKD
jgi:hypothetical protein